jgi:spore maturation protein CgeB
MAKVLLSFNKNPHFITITEYMEEALKNEAQTLFFDNRKFFLPQQIRERIPMLSRWDLSRLNRRLVAVAAEYKPDIFMEGGGNRILPETVRKLKDQGITTVLWTTDPLRVDVAGLISSAREYDFVFCAGSEAVELFKAEGLKNVNFLPYGCSPEFHYPVSLEDKEIHDYSCDIAFVGTIDPGLYSYRVSILEAISDFNLAVWGPGGEMLSADSKLKALVRGKETTPEIWRKIYQAAKIVICIHYQAPLGEVKCYQASPRVYETLACGAFLVVDDQKDVRALFKDRQDLVIFKDIAELREILKYYLEHPHEREMISRQGREKVLQEHTYLKRVKNLLETVAK